MSELVDLNPKSVLSLLPPYPIVLVTVGTNIITINQVAYFTFSPLRMGVAIAHSRYSYGLLRDAGKFVINVPDASLVDAVKLCGSISGRDGDKYAPAGLTPVPAREVDALTIVECGARIECRVDREIDFEHRTWFVGPTVAVYRREGFTGSQALLCGREAYSLLGEVVAPR